MILLFSLDKSLSRERETKKTRTNRSSVSRKRRRRRRGKYLPLSLSLVFICNQTSIMCDIDEKRENRKIRIEEDLGSSPTE